MGLSKQETSWARRYSRGGVPRCGVSCHQAPAPAAWVQCGDAAGAGAQPPHAPRAGAAAVASAQGAVMPAVGTRREELPLPCESVYGRSCKDAAGPHPTPHSAPREAARAPPGALQQRETPRPWVNCGELCLQTPLSIANKPPESHRVRGQAGSSGRGDPCSLPPMFAGSRGRLQHRSPDKTCSRWKKRMKCFSAEGDSFTESEALCERWQIPPHGRL